MTARCTARHPDSRFQCALVSPHEGPHISARFVWTDADVFPPATKCGHVEQLSRSDVCRLAAQHEGVHWSGDAIWL